MCQTKARRLILKYLEATGVPKEVLARVSGIYGIRHVRPSISDRAHTPDHERSMVGDCRDKQKSKHDTHEKQIFICKRREALRI